MELSLDKAIALCDRIERGEIPFVAVPYDDPDTRYLISTHHGNAGYPWEECTSPSHSGWLFYQCPQDPSSLFLKNKRSGKVYFIS